MSRPARVLQVLPCDGCGGTEAMVATLAERCDPREVKTIVATLDAPGPVAARLLAAGIPVHSLGARGPAHAVVRLARTIRAARPDVVCGYGLKGSLAVRLLAGRRPVVAGVRGLYVTDTERLDTPRGRVAAAVERLTARLVDVYDANSPGALEVLAGHGIPRERLRWIPNGIDLSDWPAPDRAGRSGVPVVCCVGRFIGLKRQEDLVRAAALLAARGRPLRLVLAGDGPLSEAVRAAARRLDVDAVFPGVLDRDGVRAALADADAFCLPSVWEGMPGAVMEAMAMGLPVAGTAVNGIADLVVDGHTGLLVAPRDPVALAGALETLLADPARRARMGAAGRERIATEFTLDAMVAAKTALYRSLARTGG